MDDDTATVIMVDSNKQRENLLPSEKAFAYKMKLDALKRQGSRSDLTSCQVGTKFRTDEVLSVDADDSARTIQRYIRLTNLIKPLLDMVDGKQIAFNPAVELSYLPKKEQELLVENINAMQCTPSLSQAIRLKNEAKDGNLTDDKISEIMSEEKANQRERVTFKAERIKEYFPKGYTSEQMERKIIKLLEDEKQRQKQRSSRERER
jgi:ParB family chromosome partitioning protein